MVLFVIAMPVQGCTKGDVGSRDTPTPWRPPTRLQLIVLFVMVTF